MILTGDSLLVLKDFPDNSIDSVCCDPPYGLSFMGKKWDYDVPSVALWTEVLRVLKPGGHILAFGGTRTYHRMVVNMEDAGFEIRDQVMWIYGSGFPKSMDISKAIDKAAGETRATAYVPNYKNNDFGRGMGVGEWNAPSEPPKTNEAKTWAGWGTALKPANEPICLARKPLSEKTVAKNVLKHGTGAINIDEGRIGSEIRYNAPASSLGNAKTMDGGAANPEHLGTSAQGRWPANILFDESAAQMLDEQSGDIRSRHGTKAQGYTNGGTGSSWMFKDKDKGRGQKVVDPIQNGYLGGASRFFYVAKASKRERNAGLEGMPEKVSTTAYGNRVCATCGKNELQTKLDRRCACDNPDWQSGRINPAANHHPTVKPIKLMEYLIKLITPPGGIVLDPFAGSGSTGVAALGLGFEFIGIEMSPEYAEIAGKRLEAARVKAS